MIYEYPNELKCSINGNLETFVISETFPLYSFYKLTTQSKHDNSYIIVKYCPKQWRTFKYVVDFYDIEVVRSIAVSVLSQLQYVNETELFILFVTNANTSYLKMEKMLGTPDKKQDQICTLLDTLHKNNIYISNESCSCNEQLLLNDKGEYSFIGAVNLTYKPHINNIDNLKLHLEDFYSQEVQQIDTKCFYKYQYGDNEVTMLKCHGGDVDELETEKQECLSRSIKFLNECIITGFKHNPKKQIIVIIQGEKITFTLTDLKYDPYHHIYIDNDQKYVLKYHKSFNTSKRDIRLLKLLSNESGFPKLIHYNYHYHVTNKSSQFIHSCEFISKDYKSQLNNIFKKLISNKILYSNAKAIFETKFKCNYLQTDKDGNIKLVNFNDIIFISDIKCQNIKINIEAIFSENIRLMHTFMQYTNNHVKKLKQQKIDGLNKNLLSILLD